MSTLHLEMGELEDLEPLIDIDELLDPPIQEEGTYEDLILVLILYTVNYKELYIEYMKGLKALLFWFGLSKRQERKLFLVSETLPVVCMSCGKILGYCEGGGLKRQCKTSETLEWVGSGYEKQEISSLTGFSPEAIESAWAKAIQILGDNRWQR